MLSAGLEVCALCERETVRPAMIVWQLHHILPHETLIDYSRPLHEFCEDCSPLIRVRLFAAIENVVAAVREEIDHDENG